MNGQLIGRHKGNYAAFRFDITDHVSFEEDNLLVLSVNNEMDDTVAPLSADLTFFGGLYRQARLIALANEVEALGEELLEAAHRETGLGLVRLTGERAITCNQLRTFSALLKKGDWVQASIDTSDVNRTPPNPDLRRMIRPLGPVVVFPASNFPLATLSLLQGQSIPLSQHLVAASAIKAVGFTG